jgi:3-methyladenine DNA glycosylase AlkC
MPEESHAERIRKQVQHLADQVAAKHPEPSKFEAWNEALTLHRRWLVEQREKRNASPGTS